jgi:hypothetical protein
MKTILILALIVVVCMCSRGGASGRVKPGEDERVYRDFIESYKAGDKLASQEIVKRIKKWEPTLKEFSLMLKQKKEEPLTEGERAKYNPLARGILGLEEEDPDNDVVTTILMQVGLERFLNSAFLGINTYLPREIRIAEVRKLIKLMLKLVYRPYGEGKRSITTSGVCSGGGASGTMNPEGDEEYKSSFYAGGEAAGTSEPGEKSVQDNEQIRHNYECYIECSEPLLRKIMGRVDQQAPALKKFTRMVRKKERKKKPFTENERAQFESCACIIFSLKKEHLDKDVVTSRFMRFGLKLLLDFAVFGINPSFELFRERQNIANVSHLLFNMAYISWREGERPITTSGVCSGEDASGTVKPGGSAQDDEQIRHDGNKERCERDMRLVQEDRPRKKRSILGFFSF